MCATKDSDCKECNKRKEDEENEFFRTAVAMNWY